jgi:hypothetical protein
MTIALIVALSVTVALAAATLVFAYRGRAAKQAGEGGRASEGRSVEEELRRTRDELRRARQLVNLAETLDLDEVLTRVLQSAAVLADADAAAVVLFEEGDRPVIKAMNLSAEEALPLLGSWRQDDRPQAMTIRYRFPGESSATTSAIQIGVLLTRSSWR